MNKRLFDALISISSVSSSAKTLAEQVMADSSPELVKQLYDKIQQLENRLAELTAIAEEPEEISDDEALALSNNMAIRLKDATWEEISRYTSAYLKLYPKAVRVIVATSLRNKAHELKSAPLDVWLDVIALGGELK